jgi:hypothetical protein
MSKKIKLTPSSLCPLFYIKITDEESITIKNERIWLPGFLAFSSKFCKWEEDYLITPELIEEAKYKLAKLDSTTETAKLGKALVYCFQHQSPCNSPMAQLNKQAFWLSALEDNLTSNLVQSLKLDASVDHTSELLGLVYRGVMFTFSWNPPLTLPLIEELQNIIQEHLHGEEFYSFHPIRLVTTSLWIKELKATLKLFVDKFHPSRNIPLSMDLAMQAMPSPEVRTINETSVSDQASAIAHCEGGGGMLMSAVYLLHAASHAFGNTEWMVPSY